MDLEMMTMQFGGAELVEMQDQNRVQEHPRAQGMHQLIEPGQRILDLGAGYLKQNR
jgi:hypothetical protein